MKKVRARKSGSSKLSGKLPILEKWGQSSAGGVGRDRGNRVEEVARKGPDGYTYFGGMGNTAKGGTVPPKEEQCGKNVRLLFEAPKRGCS